MKHSLTVTFIFFLLLTARIVAAQDSTFYFSTSIQAAGVKGNTPFWLQSNQFGTIPTNGSYASGQWGVYKVYNPGNPRFFQWSGGAQLITNAAKSSAVFFTDLYLAGKLGPVEISIGQRKEMVGLTDTTLTSGSISISGNARPMPRIQISTPNFVNIIPQNDILSFKLSYADGILGSAAIMYGNVKNVPNTYMHQKSFYLRIGGLRHKLSLYGGINHQAMWGGEDKIFAGGLKKSEAYNYVIFGKPWANSRVGNHFGSIDFAAEWRGNNWNIFLYRQNIFDDGSLAKLTNIADGLNGLRFKRARIDKTDESLKLNTILLEFVYTKEQGGSVFDYEKGIFGNDNYFNHYVYRKGWSYKGLALGTPLIASQDMYNKDIPRDTASFTGNNRIAAFHLGLTASWKKWDVLLKSTYSQNFGTYNTPFSPSLSQTSVLIRLERPISSFNGSFLNVSMAGDFGKLYPSNAALVIGWRKTGLIR